MFRFNKTIKMDMKNQKSNEHILACCLLLSINFETVFTSDIETNTNADIMSLDGPSTTFDGRLFLDETATIQGNLQWLYSSNMCPEWKNWWNSTLYTIYIRWQGSNAVQG